MIDNLAMGLMDLANRLRRIHPELDPSWAHRIAFYADAWQMQVDANEKQREKFNAIWNSNQEQIAQLQQAAGDQEKRANELMLERDGLARDAWRREKGLEDGVFQ